MVKIFWKADLIKYPDLDFEIFHCERIICWELQERTGTSPILEMEIISFEDSFWEKGFRAKELASDFVIILEVLPVWFWVAYFARFCNVCRIFGLLWRATESFRISLEQVGSCSFFLTILYQDWVGLLRDAEEDVLEGLVYFPLSFEGFLDIRTSFGEILLLENQE